MCDPVKRRGVAKSYCILKEGEGEGE